MKRILKHFASYVRWAGMALGTLILIFACDKESEGKKETASCFEKFDYKYEELLTKADVAKHITISEASYKEKISSTKGMYGYCEYKWLSNRPELEIEISGQIIKGPDMNIVKLTKLDFYTDSELKLYSQASALALFDQSYKKLSQPEYEELLANLKKEYAGNPTGYENAKDLLDARMNFTFQPVEDLGDRAYWKWDDTYGLELVVLAGAARFTIETKLSVDAGGTLPVAIKLAKEVLLKCGGDR